MNTEKRTTFCLVFRNYTAWGSSEEKGTDNFLCASGESAMVTSVVPVNIDFLEVCFWFCFTFCLLKLVAMERFWSKKRQTPTPRKRIPPPPELCSIVKAKSENVVTFWSMTQLFSGTPVSKKKMVEFSVQHPRRKANNRQPDWLMKCNYFCLISFSASLNMQKEIKQIYWCKQSHVASSMQKEIKQIYWCKQSHVTSSLIFIRRLN